MMAGQFSAVNTRQSFFSKLAKSRAKRKSLAMRHAVRSVVEPLEERRLLSASQLIFGQQPTNVIAGNVINPLVTVYVEDASNTIVSSDNSSVSVTIVSGAQKFGAAYVVAASSGIATFSITPTKAGVFALKAVDGALTLATSNSFTVSTAAASQIAFVQQPLGIAAGLTETPAVTVAVEDQFGNIITGNNPTINLAVNSGPGSLNGTLSIAAVSGVATFNNFWLNQTGTYTLLASAGGFTSVASNTFVVVTARNKSNLAVFGPAPGGLYPQWLTMDSAGNIYGTSTQGGANGTGIIFEIAKGTNTIITLASVPVNDSVYEDLLVDGNGNVYGTLSSGGFYGDGWVFEIHKGTNFLSALDSFNGTNGKEPLGGNLLMDGSGNLFGTTYYGGANNDGVVYEIAAGSFSITALASFSSYQPWGDIVMDANGDIFGQSLPNARLYELVKNSGVISTILPTTAAYGALTLDSNGNLYFVSNNRVDMIPNVASGISLPAVLATVPPGDLPVASLVVDQNGEIFGATEWGGPINRGTVFEIIPGTSSIVTLASLANGDLNYLQNGIPQTGIICDAAGDLFEISELGGNGYGAIFSMPVPASEHLVFIQQPINTISGAAISPAITVAIEDQNNNVVTSENSTVTMLLGGNGGGAKLSGTLSVAAVNGIATFANLAIDIAGTYTLIPSDGSISPVSSNSFNVAVGQAAKLIFVQQPTGAVAGTTISPGVTVYVCDTGSNLITGNNSTVTISLASNSTGATLNGTLSVAASGGIATFSDLSINTSGSYTLGATDGLLTSSTSGSFAITAAKASQMVFTQQPQNITVGNTTAVLLNLEDQFGNVATGDNSTVTVTMFYGYFLSPVSQTWNFGAIAGAVPFSVGNTVAGPYLLAAMDSNFGVSTAISNSFTISPGPAHWVVFRESPVNTTTGSALSPIMVWVEDVYGNLVTSDTSNVTVGLNTDPVGANLNGTSTLTTTGGVANFTDLSVTKPGNYTLVASEPGLSSKGPTWVFNITAAASQLVFTKQPSTTFVGGTLAPAVVVKVEDAFGNIVTSDNSSVTISLVSNPTAATLSGTLTITASAGVASFGDLSINKAATYTLGANDGSLTGAMSNSFIVNKATPIITWANPADITFGTALGGAQLNATANIAGSFFYNPAAGTILNPGLNQTLSVAFTPTDTADYNLANASVSINVKGPAKLVFTTVPATGTAGTSLSQVIVKIEDAQGNVVSGDTNSISLSPSAGAFAAGSVTSVNAVAGVATFSKLILTTAGNYTLTAADTADSLTSNSSSSITITPAAAKKLAYKVQPSTTVAGIAINPAIVVMVEDTYGNLVNSTAAVALSVRNNLAPIFGTLTVNAVSGTATFSNVSIQKSGGYQLNAAATGLTSVLSSSFTIKASAVSQLAFVQNPTNVVAGVNISPSITVKATDIYGNAVSGASVKLALASKPAGGALFGNVTGTTSASGIATFGGVSLHISGSYTLTASVGAVVSAPSGAFTVSPAIASKLVFTTLPSGSTHGTTFTVKVSVEDKYGNVETAQNTGTITLALGTHPTGSTLTGTLTANVVNGVATFSNLLVNLAGTYTLKAMDSFAIAAVTSGSIVVS